MNEWQFYDQHDKHQIAFNALLNERGQGIAVRLGYKKAADIKACLSCHALPEFGAAATNPALLAGGVTCVACHGPFLEWVEIHPRGSLFEGEAAPNQAKSRRNDWAHLGREEKERAYGMTDLWNPVRRAETCASCHIGNHDAGKVVTHAMYAAGHPPLPSFEVVTFSDAQPRHWEYLAQKTPARLNRLMPLPNPRNREQAQLVLISAVVVLRESMRLLAEQAAADEPEPVGGRWPDFARFDCYACHHEIQANDGASWRQVRRRDGSPGRPTLPDWPLVLIRLAIDAAGEQQAAARKAQLAQHLVALRQAANARPFGDPKTIAQAARDVATWSDSLLTSLSRTIVDGAKARQLLDRLCTMAVDTKPDYESARQIVWAFRAIFRESVPVTAKPDEVIEHVLDDLDAELALNLSSAKQQVTIEKTVQDRLRVVAEFDPGLFQAHFEMIAERLARLPAVPPPGR